MARRDHPQGEEQVVDQAEHGGQTEGPAAETEPQVHQDRAPAEQHRVHGPQPRLGGQLAVEGLQALRLRVVAEYLDRVVQRQPDLLDVVRRERRPLGREAQAAHHESAVARVILVLVLAGQLEGERQVRALAYAELGHEFPSQQGRHEARRSTRGITGCVVRFVLEEANARFAATARFQLVGVVFHLDLLEQFLPLTRVRILDLEQAVHHGLDEILFLFDGADREEAAPRAVLFRERRREDLLHGPVG